MDTENTMPMLLLRWLLLHTVVLALKDIDELENFAYTVIMLDIVYSHPLSKNVKINEI